MRIKRGNDVFENEVSDKSLFGFSRNVINTGFVSFLTDSSVKII